VIARLKAKNHDADVLDRHIALETALDGSPLYLGNKLTLLRDGAAAFRATFAAIKAAKNSINLEYYIFKDVESDGQRLGPLLIEKHRAGVTINVLYDSFGSQDTPDAFLDKLRQAGINLLDFNPLDPLEARTGWSINDRDHRKILVVDGRLAIIGGVNLDTVYTEPPQIIDPRTGKPAVQIWSDTDVEIEGPAVAALQQLFMQHWASQKGKTLPRADYFPTIPAHGAKVVRIIGSTPDDRVPKYYVSLLSAIDNAETRVWATAAYFVPTRAELHDMIAAARRGVDVRLYLPSHSDSGLALAVGHSHYADLLEAGVKIYETPPEVTLHSKFVAIDGVWSVIGSSNFDHRSILFNDEVDAVVLDRDFGAQLGALFQADIAQGTPIDPAQWARRPFTDDLGDGLARIWQALL